MKRILRFTVAIIAVYSCFIGLGYVFSLLWKVDLKNILANAMLLSVGYMIGCLFMAYLNNKDNSEPINKYAKGGLIRPDFNTHKLPEWISNSTDTDEAYLNKCIDRATARFKKQREEEKESDDDLFDVYYLGNKISSNVKRKDLPKIEDVYNPETLKLILKKYNS